MLKKMISYFRGESDTDAKWADTPYAAGKDGYASPDLVELLISAQTLRRARIKEIMQGSLYGGPGYTKETAWVITISNATAVDCEYHMLRELFQNLSLPLNGSMKSIEYNRLKQELISDDDRHYDVLTIRIVAGHKNYIIEQWFDITKHFSAI